MRLPDGVIPVTSMDPTRAEGVPSAANLYKDPTIVYGTVPGVPYCASYNAELFKYIDPKSSMAATLRKMFPPPVDVSAHGSKSWGEWDAGGEEDQGNRRRECLQVYDLMVGAAGFEPATSTV